MALAPWVGFGPFAFDFDTVASGFGAGFDPLSALITTGVGIVSPSVVGGTDTVPALIAAT